MTNHAHSRFIALDGLRGIAAIAVALRHAHIPGLKFAHGHLAVDLFFLLSGLVIAKSYEDRLLGTGRPDGRMGLGAYAIVRLERLYPLLFAGSVEGVLLWAAGLSVEHIDGAATQARALLGQFLLVPLLAGAGGFYLFNGAHWSIFFELVANMAHAALLRFLNLRVLAGIVAFSALGVALGARRFGDLDIGWTSASFAFGLFRVGFGFFGGVLIWRLRDRWMARLPVVPLWAVGAVLIVVTGLPPALTPGKLMTSLFEVGAVLLLFPPLVMVTARARGGAIAQGLGTLSFPLYALHKPVVEALWPFQLSAAASVLAVAALVVASWAIGRYVDEPLNAWRRARRRGASPLPLQSSR